MKSEVNLKELFSRYVAGKASADELSYLLDLFQQEEDSVLLRALILEELENEEQLSLTTHQHAILDRVSVVLHQNIHRRKALMRKLYIGWSAAAVLLMTGLWIGYKWMSSGTSILSSTEEVAIVPGADKATLVLEDGRVIVLDSNTNIEGKEKFVFADSGGMMTFSSACLPAPEKGQSRTVQTPKGGQFAILLVDGSKVWLNAESSITFPTQFDQSNRSVEITGEVYFEVAKDQSKPFWCTHDSRRSRCWEHILTSMRTGNVRWCKRVCWKVALPFLREERKYACIRDRCLCGIKMVVD